MKDIHYKKEQSDTKEIETNLKIVNYIKTFKAKDSNQYMLFDDINSISHQ